MSDAHVFGGDIGQVDDGRGADAHGNCYGLAQFFLGCADLKGFLNVTFQPPIPIPGQRLGDGDQLFGFSVKNRCSLCFLVELKVNLPHARIDHRV